MKKNIQLSLLSLQFCRDVSGSPAATGHGQRGVHPKSCRVGCPLGLFFGLATQGQWPCNRNRWNLEVLRYLPFFCLADFLGLNFREYPHNSYGQKYGTNVPPSVRILDFPLTRVNIQIYCGKAMKPQENHLLIYMVGGLEDVLFFSSIGNFIIPTDFHIFQRGRSTTNQLNGRFSRSMFVYKVVEHGIAITMTMAPKIRI